MEQPAILGAQMGPLAGAERIRRGQIFEHARDRRVHRHSAARHHAPDRHRDSAGVPRVVAVAAQPHVASDRQNRMEARAGERCPAMNLRGKAASICRSDWATAEPALPWPRR